MKNFHRLAAVERGLEIIDIDLQLGLAAIADRSGAYHVRLARARVGGGIEFGKRSRLARACPRAEARHLAIELEAAQALVHIGHEARLAEFPVVDDVDAELDLLAHHLAHIRAQAGGMRLGVNPLPCSSASISASRSERTRQAADVSSENAVAASFHAGHRCSLRFARVPNLLNRHPWFRPGAYGYSRAARAVSCDALDCLQDLRAADRAHVQPEPRGVIEIFRIAVHAEEGALQRVERARAAVPAARRMAATAHRAVQRARSARARLRS